MKTALIFFLFGAICGALSLHLYNESQAQHGSTPNAASHSSASTLKDQTQDAAGNVRDSVARKLQDWKLTPDDIRQDLARTGEVVRANAAVAGDKISDGRIITVIKAKYVLDRDLSALDINIDCRDGHVTLRGSVATPGLIGRAVALALDTGGVADVASKLTTGAKI